MKLNVLRSVLAVLFALLVPAAASAQTPALDTTLIDAHIGQGWFFDESAIRHDVAGIGVARRVASHFWLKATLTHMRGPGRDRDWLLLAHVSFDLVTDQPGRPVVPFVSLGGGALRHTNIDYGRNIRGIGPAVLLSAGLRVRLGERWFIAPEAALGIEPHARVGMTVGIRR